MSESTKPEEQTLILSMMQNVWSMFGLEDSKMANALQGYQKTDGSGIDFEKLLESLQGDMKVAGEAMRTGDAKSFQQTVGTVAERFGQDSSSLTSLFDKFAPAFTKPLMQHGLPENYVNEQFSMLRTALSDSPNAGSALKQFGDMFRNGGLNPHHPDNPYFQQKPDMHRTVESIKENFENRMDQFVVAEGATIPPAQRNAAGVPPR